MAPRPGEERQWKLGTHTHHSNTTCRLVPSANCASLASRSSSCRCRLAGVMKERITPRRIRWVVVSKTGDRVDLHSKFRNGGSHSCSGSIDAGARARARVDSHRASLAALREMRGTWCSLFGKHTRPASDQQNPHWYGTGQSIARGLRKWRAQETIRTVVSRAVVARRV